MKKIISITMIMIFVFLLGACGGNTEKDISNYSGTESTSETGIGVSSTEDNSLKETERITYWSGKEDWEGQEEDSGGGSVLPKKYREIYYSLTYQLKVLVPDEEYLQWLEEQEEVDESTREEMTVISFIKKFNITKEQFDAANAQTAASIAEYDEVPVMNPKDYINQLTDEVYNSDIIYTFDNDLINEYYLTPYFPFWLSDEYEYAVISGAYETQTTEFFYTEDHYCTVAMNEENADFEKIKANAARFLDPDPDELIAKRLALYEKRKNEPMGEIEK